MWKEEENRSRIDLGLNLERRVEVNSLLYSMMMDAMVLSHRSYEGEKYAYVIVDVGPCGVDGVLELIVEGAGQ